MNDLFASFEEAKEERIGIMEDSGIKDALRLAETDRHRCEISTLIRRHYPEDSDGLKAFFVDVEKHRGKEAAKRLIEDCRSAWRDRKEQDELAKRRKAIDEVQP